MSRPIAAFAKTSIGAETPAVISTPQADFGAVAVHLADVRASIEVFGELVERLREGVGSDGWRRGDGLWGEDGLRDPRRDDVCGRRRHSPEPGVTKKYGAAP